MIRIRPVSTVDRDNWCIMRDALWPGDLAGHRQRIAAFLAGDRREPVEVLIALDDAGAAVGFAELSIRNIVDGCEPGAVGYLEGWFVAESHRRRGVGRALIAAAEEWARERGCTEFGSDALLDDETSHRAHRALGFEETDRVVNFRKTL
jgi:aminoglycoside 6'-N-acetyltransferase I